MDRSSDSHAALARELAYVRGQAAEALAALEALALEMTVAAHVEQAVGRQRVAVWLSHVRGAAGHLEGMLHG